MRNLHLLAVNARLHVQVQAAFRVSLGFWIVGMVLKSFVAMLVWRVAAGDETLGGYDGARFVTYFVTSMLWVSIVSIELPWYLGSDVRNGRLATDLLRPSPPLLRYAAIDVAVLAQSLPIIVPLAVTFHVLFDGAPLGSADALFATALLFPVAYLAGFLLAGVVACAALRTVRIEGLLGIHVLLGVFLGGQFAPLGVMPDALANVARALPYYWITGFPIELAIGVAPLRDAWTGLGVLVAWSLVLAVALRWTWRRGLRAYESVGQ